MKCLIAHIIDWVNYLIILTELTTSLSPLCVSGMILLLRVGCGFINNGNGKSDKMLHPQTLGTLLKIKYTQQMLRRASDIFVLGTCHNKIIPKSTSHIWGEISSNLCAHFPSLEPPMGYLIENQWVQEKKIHEEQHQRVQGWVTCHEHRCGKSRICGERVWSESVILENMTSTGYWFLFFCLIRDTVLSTAHKLPFCTLTRVRLKSHFFFLIVNRRIFPSICEFTLHPHSYYNFR